jgi:hypothetical protein
MPPLIRRAIIFLLTAMAGFLGVGIVFYIAMFTGSLPEDPAAAGPSFMMYFLGGMMWAWVIGVLLSLGYFVSRTRLGLALLWAPVYLPVIYAPVVLMMYG